MPSAKITKSEDDVSHLIESLRGYLQYLKICGVEEVPLRELPEFKSVSEKKQKKPASERGKSIASGDIFTAAEGDKSMTLEEVQEELGDCQRCKLCSGRKNIVFGVGNPKADLVFVGEGPGQEEDIQGEPFVGRAGQLLTKIIEDGMKLRRPDVYICNIVKCRPPGNRDPEKDEIGACSPFLIKQLHAIKPKVVVALGKPAASTLLGRNVPIMRERGTWHTFEGIKLMLTYHPSFVLRRYTVEIRKQVYSDMLQVLEELKK